MLRQNTKVAAGHGQKAPSAARPSGQKKSGKSKSTAKSTIPKSTPKVTKNAGADRRGASEIKRSEAALAIKCAELETQLASAAAKESSEKSQVAALQARVKGLDAQVAQADITLRETNDEWQTNHDEAMQTLTQSAAEREAEFAARITELERFIERKGFDAVRLQTIDDDGAGAENVETATQSQAALDEVAALAETLQAQQERSDALVQRLQSCEAE